MSDLMYDGRMSQTTTIAVRFRDLHGEVQEGELINPFSTTRQPGQRPQLAIELDEEFCMLVAVGDSVHVIADPGRIIRVDEVF